jgi:hypothetical protein
MAAINGDDGRYLCFSRYYSLGLCQKCCTACVFSEIVVLGYPLRAKMYISDSVGRFSVEASTGDYSCQIFLLNSNGHFTYS